MPDTTYLVTIRIEERLQVNYVGVRDKAHNLELSVLQINIDATRECECFELLEKQTEHV